MMQNMSASHESTQDPSSQYMSVGTISRKELKGIVAGGTENSTNFESSSFGIGTSR
jgi:hypothetical protein